jgi:hypothetical protein
MGKFSSLAGAQGRRRARNGLDFSVFSWKMGPEISAEDREGSSRTVIGREIDRKLRLTAAALGTVTRKDLAAAFRRVNPATPFDVDRADKWLQGRARPREAQVYEDWAKLLDLGRSGQWIAECDEEAFLDALCSRHQHDRDVLQRRAKLSSGTADRAESDLAVVGTYVSYSYSWSPYFRGRMLRGELSIAAGQTPGRLIATYSQLLPRGRFRAEGSLVVGNRSMHMELCEPGGDALLFCLFLPSLPMSILAGLVSGTTTIGPEPQPSVARIAMVRLPGPSPRLRETDAYLSPHASVVEDLAALGLHLADSAEMDRHLVAFLSRGDSGIDQLSAPSYRALVELFDQNWLASTTNLAS